MLRQVHQVNRYLISVVSKRLAGAHLRIQTHTHITKWYLGIIIFQSWTMDPHIREHKEQWTTAAAAQGQQRQIADKNTVKCRDCPTTRSTFLILDIGVDGWTQACLVLFTLLQLLACGDDFLGTTYLFFWKEVKANIFYCLYPVCGIELELNMQGALDGIKQNLEADKGHCSAVVFFQLRATAQSEKWVAPPKLSLSMLSSPETPTSLCTVIPVWIQSSYYLPKLSGGWSFQLLHWDGSNNPTL